jgi:hypothetical protein
MNFKILFLSMGLLVVITTSGCCSIVSSKSTNIPINASPPEANILVIDAQQGIIVHRLKGVGMAPLNGMTTLGNGQKVLAQYQIYAFAKGYFPSYKIVLAKYNPWMFGNLIFIGAGGFGGIIAMAIDTANGVAYVMPEDQIQIGLRRVTDDADELRNPVEKEFYDRAKNLSAEEYEKAMMQRIEVDLNSARSKLQQNQNKK